MSAYIISTARLGLPKWIDADTNPFITMNQDPDVMRYFPKLLTAGETMKMIQRIKLQLDTNNWGLFAVENKITNQFLGFTGFSIPRFESFFTPCIEIGWRFKKEAWGQGFATEAAAACLQYGFNSLGFQKIVSFTSRLNTNSEKVMQRIGMQYLTGFDHPNIEKDNPLCPHVLYEIAPGEK